MGDEDWFRNLSAAGFIDDDIGQIFEFIKSASVASAIKEDASGCIFAILQPLPAMVY